jgi:hypothetical protein
MQHSLGESKENPINYRMNEWTVSQIGHLPKTGSEGNTSQYVQYEDDAVRTICWRGTALLVNSINKSFDL